MSVFTLAAHQKQPYLWDMEQKDWENKVKGLVKAELKKRNTTYNQLVERLADIGVKESEANIRNKLSRGKFTAVFMVQVLGAIGCEKLIITE